MAIQQGVLDTIPDPQGVIVVGPAPIQQQNIAAYLDQSNVAAALQIAYGRRDLEAGLSFSQEQFDSYPPGQRFDIRPVSQLEPDTTVDAG